MDCDVNIGALLEYMNKDAVESCKDSIHFERNNLKYLEEMVQSTKDEIADIQKNGRATFDTLV